MAEHIRDFLHPVIDEEAHIMLASANDPTTLAAAMAGRAIFRVMGAELRSNTYDSEIWRFHDKNGNPADVEFSDPSAIAAWTIHGSKGMLYSRTGSSEALWRPVEGSTYIAPDVRTGYPESDGLVSVTTALHHGTRRSRRIAQVIANAVAPVRDKWALAHWDPSIDQTKEEIMTHYDHDQSFFVGPQGILGEHYLYSSGLVLPGQGRISLEQMQQQKIDSLLDQLQLGNADTLLEIGSGWGEMAIQAAKANPNLHVTSLTLSPEQVKICRERARTEGVEHQIDFLELDYRNFGPDQRFDRILSVEMIEAVAWQGASVFFDAIDKHLDPDTGIAVVQPITVPPEQEARQRHHSGFAQKIFPGGSLLAVRSIIRELEKRNLRLHQMKNLSDSYGPTLREWRRNEHEYEIPRTQRRVSKGIDPRTSARSDDGHDFYLAISETGFRVGAIEDWQLMFSRD